MGNTTAQPRDRDSWWGGITTASRGYHTRAVPIAHFVLIVDPDPDRRGRFAAAAHDRLPPMDGLRVQRVALGNCEIVWAIASHTPVSHALDTKWIGVVWGHALDGDAPNRVGPAELRHAWGHDARSGPHGFDGFHAAALYERQHGVVVGADVLGVFPVYYAATDSVLIVSSSPEPVTWHPLLPSRLSTAGLVDLLLTSVATGGYALLEGVRRLGAGRVLAWSPGGQPRERTAFTLPATTRHPVRSRADHVAVLDETLDDVVRRHAAAAPSAALLLTGGRDSRTLAGYLRRHRATVRALTMGVPSDYEAHCATRVARTSGFEHRVVADRLDHVEWAARLVADWEHLAAAFSTGHTWGLVDPLRTIAPACWVGYMADVLIGGVGRATESSDLEDVSFARLLRQLGRRAVTPDVARRLLRPELGRDVVDQGVRRLETAFVDASPHERQRRWRFVLGHYERFSTGGIAWRVAFGAWPIMPMLDRTLLRVVAELPPEVIARRQAQDEILRTRFPDLARLPLVVRNADIELPSGASRTDRFRYGAWRRVGRSPGLRRLLGWGERRYAYRVYDFNGPGWRVVRQLAEPHRELLGDVFNLDVLGQLLPAPEVEVPFENPVHGPYGRKLLVGLMLWASTHIS